MDNKKSETADENFDEQSLAENFRCCEAIIEDALKGNLGESTSAKRNEALKQCIQKLQSLARAIEQLALFSTNDAVEELTTSSLPYLLVPAYLAYAIQEINTAMEKRSTYLSVAKKYYREFLKTMQIFELISFRLPWLTEEYAEDGDSAEVSTPPDFDELAARRQEKISRMRQLNELEQLLEKLRVEQRRNNDEATQREIYLMLLRLWSMRAVKELGLIEEELKMLKHIEDKRKSGEPEGTKPAEPAVKFRPFIIARTEEQKRVFGLGYPSVPTVTVDEWYDQMSKSGAFGAGRQKPVTITGDEGKKGGDSTDEDADQDDEAKRRKQMERDEWRDVNPRGWGNTYNKG